MLKAVLAKRYAKALVALAQEKNIMDQVETEILLLSDMLSANRGSISVPELTSFLGMPRVPLAEKIRVTDIMLEKLSFSEEVGNFLNVLIAKYRVPLLDNIADSYCRLVASHKGVATVEAESAFELAESDRRSIKVAIETALGKEVDLAVKINPDLIAGIRVAVDGKVIDGSIEGALAQMESRLSR